MSLYIFPHLRLSIQKGDLGLFSQGLETIANVLMGVGFEKSCSYPLAKDQRRATITGLISLVNSAQELFKSHDISEDEYVMLLGATFLRHPSMDWVFALFRSCLYHSAVMKSKEKAKIGKRIILYCISKLTLPSSMLSQQSDGGGRSDIHQVPRSSGIASDCKDREKGDKGLACVTYYRDTSAFAFVQGTANGIGIGKAFPCIAGCVVSCHSN